MEGVKENPVGNGTKMKTDRRALRGECTRIKEPQKLKY
jgi:hypothetical protein